MAPKLTPAEKRKATIAARAAKELEENVAFQNKSQEAGGRKAKVDAKKHAILQTEEEPLILHKLRIRASKQCIYAGFVVPNPPRVLKASRITQNMWVEPGAGSPRACRVASKDKGAISEVSSRLLMAPLLKPLSWRCRRIIGAVICLFRHRSGLADAHVEACGGHRRCQRWSPPNDFPKVGIKLFSRVRGTLPPPLPYKEISYHGTPLDTADIGKDIEQSPVDPEDPSAEQPSRKRVSSIQTAGPAKKAREVVESKHAAPDIAIDTEDENERPRASAKPVRMDFTQLPAKVSKAAGARQAKSKPKAPTPDKPAKSVKPVAAPTKPAKIIADSPSEDEASSESSVTSESDSESEDPGVASLDDRATQVQSIFFCPITHVSTACRSMAEIEITDRPFLPADWIGKGKQYLGAPWEVINAKNTAFALSAKAVETIPDGNLPVLKFVDLVLPRISSELGPVKLPPRVVRPKPRIRASKT
ncbi:hypothetical protein B0H16DRAFT_1699206 [Mycena metata]|uniref:Uncharacterized protein n=1 Tax=Mycena metata TaxID=1033252 RepID=A0AAD7HLI5_9AGAR|nr:hypothetical protein B0H16DRAFT_1699206 [Mycena metata]